MTVYGIIPARGGSKRVRSKNTSPLLGRPLMAWTCDAAKAAHSLDAVYVSTEDADVREVARREGIAVIDRPEEYASDTATTESVLLHAAWHQAFSDDDVIVCLQPTSPLRTGTHIDEAVALLTAEFNSVVSVVRDPGMAFGWCMGFMGEDRRGLALFDPAARPRTQDVRCYREQGAIYCMRVDGLRTTGLRCPEATALYEMDPIASKDVDSYSDLDECGYWLSRQLMRRKSEYADAAGWLRGGTP